MGILDITMEQRNLNKIKNEYHNGTRHYLHVAV